MKKSRAIVLSKSTARKMLIWLSKRAHLGQIKQKVILEEVLKEEMK
jgi:hypothetical protein